jgi:hypothetical protein
MITLHIEAANLQDLRTKVAQALGDVLIPEAMYVADTKPASVAKSAKPKITETGNAPAPAAAPAAETPTPAPTPAPEPVVDTVVDTPAADGALDYDIDVKPAVLAVSKALGRPGVEDLLKPFNVTNAKFVQVEDYARLITAAQDMLEPRF